ncbi:MAG: ABC transporter permease [Patescibacteria group bacterium]
MTGQRAIIRKEFREILGTYKVYVIPAIFLFFGLTSPLIAKFTPELVKSLAKGVEIKIPPPTAIDAYGQFLKNLRQIGLLAVIFTSIGLVAEEKLRGTAALMLAKPVPRWAFIAGKFLAGAALIAVSTALAYLACLYYTTVLFGTGLFGPSAQAALLMLAYYLLILAVTLLASTVARSVALAGAIAVGGFIALSILPSLHRWLALYSPGALAGYELRLLAGGAAFADTVPALAVTLGLTGALVALAMFVFGRQEL